MSDLFTPTVARMPAAYAANPTSTTATSTTARTDASAFMQSTTDDNLSLTMQDFLELMVAQFQNQDIDNTASTTDMMNQLISMTTIQAMSTMTDASVMSYAASLVGKTVTVGEYSGGSLKEIVGEVTGTGTYNGEQVIFIDGKQYALNQIMAVGELPAEDEGSIDGTGDGSEDGDTTTEGGDLG